MSQLFSPYISVLGFTRNIAWSLLAFFLSGLFTELAIASGHEEKVDVLAARNAPLSLTHHFAVLEDAGRKLTLSDVRDPLWADKFVSMREQSAIGFGYSSSAYWLRLTLSNPSSQPTDRMIEIAYASLSHVSFYKPGANGPYEAIHTGSNHPFSSRAYPNRFFVFPLTIPANEEQTVYFRVQSTSSVLIPARLWTPQAYYQHQRNDYFYQAWYFGIACAMVIFNLLLFMVLRDRIYLLYSVFVSLMAFTFATDYGLSKEVFWPDDASVWSDIANFVGYSCAAVTSILFMREIIRTRLLVPRLDRLLIVMLSLNLLFLIGIIISLETFALATVMLYIVSVSFILVVAGYCSFVKRRRSARIFLLASSSFLIGCIIAGLSFVGMMPINAFTENAMQIGSALEMLLLAFALADRVSELQREKRIAAIAFESQECIIITDAEQRVIRVNHAFTETTGYSPDQVMGKNPWTLNSDRHDEGFYHQISHSIRTTGIWQGEMWNKRASGEEYPVLLTITAVKDAAGVIKNYVGTLIDITLRKKAEAEINNLAYYDPLTQLPNRRMLMKRLSVALATSGRNRTFGALLFIDLDDFKTINDTLGHDLGDALLQEVAFRLRANLRESDTVARLGGDEFVVLLEELNADLHESATEAEIVAEKILESLGRPFQLGQYSHIGGASVGVTIFDGEELSVEELLKRTDLAMYDAKKVGGNTVRFFDPGMQEAVLARFALEAALREAIDRGQFAVHYQSQVGEDGKIIGVEALARWQHPRRGLVSPAEFIPIAESSKLIIPIGEWVLRTACEQLVAWAEHPAFSHLTIAVNVSSIQFRLPSFVADVLRIIESTGANPHRLKLELTESLLVDDVEDVISKMAALKAECVSFSLDDFGTGYSSLAYIKRMPFDQLKIDKSFVQDTLVDANDATIAKTIIGLADSLGLGVIAEGVEDSGQFEFLKQAGCREFQGFFFSRPQPIEAFEPLIQPTDPKS